MDRLKLNLLISALMFLCVMAITGTALLARFVLGADETLMMFGMDHDGWETIHFIFGCTFLTLLALHIILHWHAIVHLYRRSIPSQTARVVIGIVFVGICIMLIAFPFIIKPQKRKVDEAKRVDEVKVKHTQYVAPSTGDTPGNL